MAAAKAIDNPRILSPKGFVFDEISPGDFDIVFKHDVLFF